MIGKIYIKKTATNIMVTFTDLFGQVIFCASSYSALLEDKNDKRKRLSSFAVENIVDKLYGYISMNDVGHLIIVSRLRSKILMFALIRKLKFYGLRIFGYIKEFVNPHNGVKSNRHKYEVSRDGPLPQGSYIPTELVKLSLLKSRCLRVTDGDGRARDRGRTELRAALDEVDEGGGRGAGGGAGAKGRAGESGGGEAGEGDQAGA